MKISHAIALLGGLTLGLGACGSPGGDGDGDGGSGDGDGGPCVNLACQQVECPGGGTTSISGVVNIPAGDLPLPNVFVYVPNAPVEPIVQGVSCDRCGEELSGSPLVQTRTDIKGEFVLTNMPVGEDIPVVVQVGKWRRFLTIPAVDACVDHPLDATVTRLPANRQEGDIPKIALTTGRADALECLLRKIGLDDSEFTPETADGRVNFYVAYQGTDAYDSSLNGGADFTSAWDWWDDLGNLSEYDIVIHSCEGRQDAGNKSMAAREALRDFTNIGGRVFASHWHNIWLEGGPDDFQAVATWDHPNNNPPNPTTGYIDRSFEKGNVLAEWMYLPEVGGSEELGELEISQGRRTLGDVDSSLATRWIWIEPGDTERQQYFSFNTPVGDPPEQQCGRVVFSDIHVSSGDRSRSDVPFPTGCTTVGLTPQEKALVFMIFDISGCIEPDIIVD
jgi:hypothetical protein